MPTDLAPGAPKIVFISSGITIFTKSILNASFCIYRPFLYKLLVILDFLGFKAHGYRAQERQIVLIKKLYEDLSNDLTDHDVYSHQFNANFDIYKPFI